MKRIKARKVELENFTRRMHWESFLNKTVNNCFCFHVLMRQSPIAVQTIPSIISIIRTLFIYNVLLHCGSPPVTTTITFVLFPSVYILETSLYSTQSTVQSHQLNPKRTNDDPCLKCRANSQSGVQSEASVEHVRRIHAVCSHRSLFSVAGTGLFTLYCSGRTKFSTTVC